MPTPCPPAPPRRTRTAPAARILALTALLLAAAAVAAPRPAAADTGAGDFVARINGLRTSRGLRPLAVDGNLTALAQGHSAEMAGGSDLHHTGDLKAGVSTTWSKLGENVGMGPNNDVVWRAFVNSPAHFQNLVDPAFTHVGVATVWVGGTEWTTHRFRAGPDAPAPAPPPPPPPPPPPAPAPAPAPAPRIAAEPAAAPAPVQAPAPVAVKPEVTTPSPAPDDADADATAPAGSDGAAPAAAPADQPDVTPLRGGLEQWLAEAAARAVRRAQDAGTA
jgi:uncharacterized protein YkwD